MAFHVTRTLSSGALGLVSGGLNGGFVDPIKIGTTNPTVIQWATVAEAVGFVGGAMMQQFMPYTVPDIVDGVVDGAIALLGRRGAELVLKNTTGKVPVAPSMLPGINANPMLSAGWSRAQVGGTGRILHAPVS